MKQTGRLSPVEGHTLQEQDSESGTCRNRAGPRVMAAFVDQLKEKGMEQIPMLVTRHEIFWASHCSTQDPSGTVDTETRISTEVDKQKQKCNIRIQMAVLEKYVVYLQTKAKK